MDTCLRRALLMFCLGFGSGCLCKGMDCFYFISIHPLYIQYMTYLSVESDQRLTACYHWVVMLWFWYLIKSSRGSWVYLFLWFAAVMSHFFNVFWYKVNEIQENDACGQNLNLSLSFSLTFQSFTYSSSPMFSSTFLTHVYLITPVWSRPISFPVSFTFFASFCLAEPSSIFF